MADIKISSPLSSAHIFEKLKYFSLGSLVKYFLPLYLKYISLSDEWTNETLELKGKITFYFLNQMQ
ncbi:hypothetical protein OM999_03620 [Mycoplasmopsis cynos]|uniref:hypothetical protein n=1 Tax=Mycoplasmopsis cynos TaxID=171284 RepID=UPI0024C54B13|nr:hypothetical protein OM999_03620 [Mycoplasmopsis cynos]